MTDNETNQACDALMDWFKSQGILPHEAVHVCERFISKMLLANIQQGSLEEKLVRIEDRIRAYIANNLMEKR